MLLGMKVLSQCVCVPYLLHTMLCRTVGSHLPCCTPPRGWKGKHGTQEWVRRARDAQHPTGRAGEGLRERQKGGMEVEAGGWGEGGGVRALPSTKVVSPQPQLNHRSLWHPGLVFC